MLSQEERQEFFLLPKFGRIQSFYNFLTMSKKLCLMKPGIRAQLPGRVDSLASGVRDSVKS